MKAFKTQWHCDAGHEWLEVSALEFMKAKLKPNDISAFSYMRRDKNFRITFFLEGDLDAAIFLKAWEKEGLPIDDSAEATYYSGRCFIRELPRTNFGGNKPRYDLIEAA